MACICFIYRSNGCQKLVIRKHSSLSKHIFLLYRISTSNCQRSLVLFSSAAAAVAAAAAAAAAAAVAAAAAAFICFCGSVCMCNYAHVYTRPIVHTSKRFSCKYLSKCWFEWLISNLYIITYKYLHVQIQR